MSPELTDLVREWPTRAPIFQFYFTLKYFLIVSYVHGCYCFRDLFLDTFGRPIHRFAQIRVGDQLLQHLFICRKVSKKSETTLFFLSRLSRTLSGVRQPNSFSFLGASCRQLRIEQKAGRVFKGWEEGRIYFAPTYKYLANSDRYAVKTARSKDKRRTPAWYSLSLSLSVFSVGSKVEGTLEKIEQNKIPLTSTGSRHQHIVSSHSFNLTRSSSHHRLL